MLYNSYSLCCRGTYVSTFIKNKLLRLCRLRFSTSSCLLHVQYMLCISTSSWVLLITYTLYLIMINRTLSIYAKRTYGQVADRYQWEKFTSIQFADTPIGCILVTKQCKFLFYTNGIQAAKASWSWGLIFAS